MKFAIIGGAGKMGAAFVDGLLRSGEVNPDNIEVTARHSSSLEAISAKKLRSTLDNAAAVQKADIVVLAVGPEDVTAVLRDVQEYIGQVQLMVSIVTGVSTSLIETMTGESLPIVRANPNIAALVSESATVICRGSHARDEHVALARRLFATLGVVEELDERHMNVSTGLGGCGPAFVFKIIEAMSEGGVKMGMPRDVSCRIAAQVIKGAAELVLTTGKHPAALKDEVTTPGGCTIDGIAKLQERGIAIALIDAVETSSRKAGLLWE